MGQKNGFCHVPLLDVRVTPLTADQLLDSVVRKSDDGEINIILGHNLHSVYLYHTNQTFRKLYETANIILIDGQPIRWLTNMSTPHKLGAEYRIGSVDWLRKIGDQRGFKVAVVGASDSSNRKTCEVLQQRLGSESVVSGWPGSPWSDELSESVLNEVNQFSPDLLLIGLGMPLQEYVLLNWLDRLSFCSTVALVGGAIDQISGTQKRAPAWIGRIGLEWLWRFILSPTRLFERYFVEPLKLSLIVLKNRLFQ